MYIVGESLCFGPMMQMFFLSRYTKLGYAGNTEPQLILPSSRAGKKGEGERMTKGKRKGNVQGGLEPRRQGIAHWCVC